MAQQGRPKKTVIQVSARYGVSCDLRSYTIEEYSDSQGWRPIQWHGTLTDCAVALLELTSKGRIVEFLGAGVSKLKQETAELILKEVASDAERIQLKIREAKDVWDL